MEFNEMKKLISLFIIISFPIYAQAINSVKLLPFVNIGDYSNKTNSTSFSVYSSLKPRQPRNRKIHEMVRAMGIKTYNEDGNDALKCYKILNNSSKEIRNKGNPIFIEFYTYRWREHCGPNFDNSIGYRTEKEYLKWKKNDPIIKLKKYIINKKILKNEDIIRIENQINLRVKKAFNYAENSSFPNYEEITNKVYA